MKKVLKEVSKESDKKTSEGEQITTSNNQIHSSCENQKLVFLVAEGSLPQVMVPEGGDEAETPTHNLTVIFFLANL